MLRHLSRAALCVAAAALAPHVVRSQAPRSRSLTLQEAIALALASGSSSEVARSVRDAAQQRDRAFNARLLPQLFVSGNAANYNRGINPITLPDGSTQYVGQSQNQSSLQMGFSQRLPLTGGLVSVGSALSRVDQYPTTGIPGTRLYQASPLVISLQQDLFKPRNVVWDKRVQSLSATVAQRGYLEVREDIAGTTAGAFFDLYAQQITLANAAKNVAVNDTLFTLNTGRFEVGKIGENDLLKSELALLRSRAAMADAALARDRAEATLRRIIALPAGQSFSIVTPDSIPDIAADPDVAVLQALRNSSVVQQAVFDDVQAKRGISQARLNNRFNASINASVGFNQTARAFSESYQSPLARQTLNVFVNLPVLQWGAGSADVQEASAIDRRTSANNRARREALVEDARFSALALQQAQRNLVIAAKADTVAAKQFEVARNRYSIGKISNTDLYNAQNEKDAAVLANVLALRTYWTAFYYLRRVTLYDFAAKRDITDSAER
ncbi:MAG: TolC family protein [Gemmatimonadaceae bacterium]|nr:TolC family protein [Gemmatimonadaceae bacterium]